MRPTLTLIVVFFLVLPLLALSYQLGTPENFNLAKSEVSAYFNRPPLRLPLVSSSQAQSPKGPLPSRKIEVAEPTLVAKSALAWDFNRSLFLFEKNVDTPSPIASLTKLVTAAVVLDYAAPEEKIVISRQAVLTEGDSGNLREGELLYVRDLLVAALLESSNDAAWALAEHVGSKLTDSVAATNPERAFVRAMNQKFNDLGLVNNNFIDAAGLEDVKSFSTASDLAHFVKYLRANPKYSPIWEILILPSFKAESQNGIAVHDFKNNNPLLTELNGVVGGKTGFTPKALGNMVLVAKSPDLKSEIIYLVLGSPDRFGDIKKLVDWAGQAWSWPAQY